MTNEISETDNSVVFTPDGEPYVHLNSMVEHLAATIVASQNLDAFSADHIHGMESVLDFLRQQHETLTLEYKMRH